MNNELIINPKRELANLFQILSNLSACLIPALALILKSGYSYGSALLLTTALLGLPWWWPNRRITREIYLLLGSFVLMAILHITDALVSNQSAFIREFPTQYVAACFILLFLTAYPPKSYYLWLGFIFGAIGGGLTAGYYTFIEYIPRASFYLNAIQFGNIAIVLAICNLCYLIFGQPSRFLGKFILVMAFFLGLTASLLSQSRGGWLAFLLASTLLLILFFDKKWLNTFTIFSTLAAIFLSVSLIILTSGEIIKNRLSQLKQEIHQFNTHHDTETSIGARIALWKFAIEEGLKYPLFGAGSQKLEEDKTIWAESQQHVQSLGHMHNDYLDALARKGLIGLFSVLYLFGLPIYLFRFNISIKTAKPETKALAAAGTAVAFSYMGFGLTQMSLAHNSGILMFLLPICLFYSTFMQTLQPNGAKIKYD